MAIPITVLTPTPQLLLCLCFDDDSLKPSFVRNKRAAELDQRNRACREAERLLNQYFVFVGRHKARHVASSLVLAYVFGREGDETVGVLMRPLGC